MSSFIDEALDRYDTAQGRIQQLQDQLVIASRERTQALLALHEGELSYREISDLIGISPARVGQLIKGMKELPAGESPVGGQSITGWKFAHKLRDPDFRRWLRAEGWSSSETGNVYPVPAGGSVKEVLASMTVGRHLLVVSDPDSRFGLRVRIVENHAGGSE